MCRALSPTWKSIKCRSRPCFLLQKQSIIRTTGGRAGGTVRTVHDRIHGDFDMPGMPLKFSKFPKDLPLEAATLGQHNEDVVTTYLGRSKDEVRQLKEAGGL